MSRYEKNLGTETLSVGWDEPMNTFFAQVSTNQSDDDLRDLPLVLWLGGNNSFQDVAVLARWLKNKGYELDAAIIAQLYFDKTVGASKTLTQNAVGWKKKL